MAMTKCKECGGKLSTKAESCPTCGAKTKGAQEAFVKFVSSLLSLGIFLWLGWMVLGFLTSPVGVEGKRDPQSLLAELERKCSASASEAPSNWGDKRSVHDACIAGGRAQLRAQGLID